MITNPPLKETKIVGSVGRDLLKGLNGSWFSDEKILKRFRDYLEDCLETNFKSKANVVLANQGRVELRQYGEFPSNMHLDLNGFGERCWEEFKRNRLSEAN